MNEAISTKYGESRGSATPVISAEANVPLCVDLDGTLVRSDSLVDACLALLRAGLVSLWIPIWLLKGKAHLKKKVAEHDLLDVAAMPYNEELVVELRRQYSAGRTILLCSGADEIIACKVAEHLGIFTEVIASDGRVNRVGANKREVLESRFGKGGYDYIGDSEKDLPVWQSAREAHVVNPSRSVLRSLKRSDVSAGKIYPKRTRSRLRSWIRAIRVHQWAKNSLVFAPLVLAHRFDVMEALLAFFAFGFAASAGYVINDLLDLQNDRKHAEKRRRPFASGELSVGAGVAAIPVLLLLAIGICLVLPPRFSLILILYFISSLAYSLYLKQRAVVDVIVLAGLYTVRIVAGAVATGIVISPWTAAASVFLFLSLALAKRVSELREFREGETTSVPGRNYMKSDIPQLISLGGAAGYMSVLVTALYISTDLPLYKEPRWLWLILPVQLYWISRFWLYTSRGWINQDPLLFAIKDPKTYLAGVVALAVAVLAIYAPTIP